MGHHSRYTPFGRVRFKKTKCQKYKSERNHHAEAEAHKVGRHVTQQKNKLSVFLSFHIFTLGQCSLAAAGLTSSQFPITIGVGSKIS